MFSVEDRLHTEIPPPTNGTIRAPQGDWAIRVYDLFLEINPDGTCFAAYVMEFADDPATLYSK
jgi:hypothetical protein